MFTTQPPIFWQSILPWPEYRMTHYHYSRTSCRAPHIQCHLPRAVPSNRYYREWMRLSNKLSRYALLQQALYSRRIGMRSDADYNTRYLRLRRKAGWALMLRTRLLPFASRTTPSEPRFSISLTNFKGGPLGRETCSSNLLVKSYRHCCLYA